jgi:hypothetical protein
MINQLPTAPNVIPPNPNYSMAERQRQFLDYIGVYI